MFALLQPKEIRLFWSPVWAQLETVMTDTVVTIARVDAFAARILIEFLDNGMAAICGPQKKVYQTPYSTGFSKEPQSTY